MDSSKASTSKPRVRTRSYREFLTTALHRRFAEAFGLTLLICYIEAVVIQSKSSWLWSWFPFGPVGLQTGLLCISSLVIFILRIGQLHFGTRTTASSFETFYQYLFRFDTIQTLALYSFSAWWFSEVYIWSAPYSANLRLVAEGKSYERPQLNDRPIYLKSVHLMLGLMQGVFHLYYDYGKIVLNHGIQSSDGESKSRLPPIMQIWNGLPLLLLRNLRPAIIMSLLGPFLYVIFIQRLAWIWNLKITKLIWSISKTAKPSWWKPFNYSMYLRSMSSGFLLISLWELSNITFSSYLAQPPLKRGEPLTDNFKGRSSDPNGSLLNGLKSQKEVTKTFAFWELSYISQHSEARRRLIFSELDRAGGSTWTQIATVCLKVIGDINIRVSNVEKSTSPSTSPDHLGNGIATLPRLSGPLKDENILSNPALMRNTSAMLASSIGSFAKNAGQSPNAKTPLSSLSPQAKKYFNAARNKMLTPEQQKLISSDNAKSSINTYLVQILHSPVGIPFRQTFGRRLCTKVLGTPYSELSVVLNAVDSLTGLAVSSLQEDKYGMVSKDVPQIINQYVITINTINSFSSALVPHWTDVTFDAKAGQGRRSKEVDVLVERLRLGLAELLTIFSDHFVSLGLSRIELKRARQTAGLDAPK